MITTTATDIQNNFGKYLKAVQEGNETVSYTHLTLPTKA